MRIRRECLSWLLPLALSSFGSFAMSANDSAVERRIERIRDAIPSAVVVEGKPIGKSTLLDRMAALHVPGVSVAVIHGGRLEWARGFGVTRVGGAPVTAQTLFLAGSISKPVTALAVLQRVQSGQLDLDTNVNQYLKSWKIPENEFTAQSKVTLRELLSHTAGITVEGFGGYGVGQPLPSLVQMLDGLPPAGNEPIRVDTRPGVKWRYSGGGYVICGKFCRT